MKKFFFLLTGAVLMFAGCAKVENENTQVVPEKGTHSVTIQATINNADTRVSADNDGVFAWQETDQISVITKYGSLEGELVFSNGITITDDKATFTFDLNEGQTLGQYAFYPAAEGCMVDSDGFIGFGLRHQLDYAPGVTNMPMLGTLSPNGASFAPVGGVIKLTVANVPSEANYLRFSVPGKKIAGTFLVDNGAIAAEDYDGSDLQAYNYVDIIIPDYYRESTMEFYIPVPTGNLGNPTFAFYKTGQTDPLYSVSPRIQGGLVIERKDIIVPPTLDCGQSSPAAPNIHDYITFSDETLRYFPELASDHPVIRIPRKEFDMSFEWYRFSYSDDIPSVELDGGNGAYGAHFVDDDNPNASWEDTWLFVGWNSSRGMCIYPRSMSNWLRSGKMVFSTNETYQNGYPTFEVPVEEYYVPTLKKNGIPVHNNESLMMYPGEAPAVITVEIPKWMTVESHDWTIYDQDGIASFSDETDDSDEYVTRYSRTVSIDPTLPYGSCRVVFNSYLSYEHMTSVGIQQMGYGVDCGINVFPFHIYDQNDNNLTNSYLYLNRGDRLTLEPRFYGISANQIEDVMWYDDSGWYEVPGTDEWEYDPERSILNLSYNSAAPYKVEITVKDNAEGEGHVSCWVKLVGEEDYNWDVSLSIYLKNSSATVSHAPSVPKYTATKNRHLSKYPHSF